ncbi:nucleotide-binding alpha-beta plait domain-containing protein [Tanacetum coccineum]
MAGDDPIDEGISDSDEHPARRKAPKTLGNEKEHKVTVCSDEMDTWKLYTDGASNDHGSGAGLILIDPEGVENSYALRLNFENSNNDAEYEALLAGLRIAAEMKVEKIHAFIDSKFVASQVEGSYEATAKKQRMEELNERSVDMAEVNVIVEEETRTWMTSIGEYIEKGILPKDPAEARTIREKVNNYIIEDGILYRKSYIGPLLCCIGLKQANYVIRELHMSCDSFQVYATVQRLPKDDMISVTSAWPFIKWGMDIIGLLSEALGRFEVSAVVITDSRAQAELEPFGRTKGNRNDKGGQAYAPHSTSREYTLKTQLLRIEMHGDETLDAYLNCAQEYADALAAIGEPVKDKDLVMVVVLGLREEYNGLKTTITSLQSPTAFSELHVLLSDHDYMLGKTRAPALSITSSFAANYAVGSPSMPEARQAQFLELTTQLSALGFQVSPIVPSGPQAFYGVHPSNNNRNNNNNKCGNRNNSHGNNNNRGRGNGRQFDWASTQNTLYGTCNRCGIGHIPLQCPNCDPSTICTRPSTNFANTHGQSSNASTNWHSDTGTNSHVTPDLEAMDNSKAYYGDDALHVGNGKGLPILHIGSSKIYSPQKTSTLQAFTDVLWKGDPDTSLEAFSDADWARDSDDR